MSLMPSSDRFCNAWSRKWILSFRSKFSLVSLSILLFCSLSVKVLCGRPCTLALPVDRGRFPGENERCRCLNSLAMVSGTWMFWTCCAIAVSVMPAECGVGPRGVTGGDVELSCSSSSFASALSARNPARTDSPLIPRLKAGIPSSLFLDISDATLPRLGSRERLILALLVMELSPGTAPPVWRA